MAFCGFALQDIAARERMMRATRNMRRRLKLSKKLVMASDNTHSASGISSTAFRHTAPCGDRCEQFCFRTAHHPINPHARRSKYGIYMILCSMHIYDHIGIPIRSAQAFSVYSISKYFYCQTFPSHYLRLRSKAAEDDEEVHPAQNEFCQWKAKTLQLDGDV